MDACSYVVFCTNYEYLICRWRQLVEKHCSQFQGATTCLKVEARVRNGNVPMIQCSQTTGRLTPNTM